MITESASDILLAKMTAIAAANNGWQNPAVGYGAQGRLTLAIIAARYFRVATIRKMRGNKLGVLV